VFGMCTRVYSRYTSKVRPSEDGHVTDFQCTPNCFHILDVFIEAEARTIGK
jgi:hypothetical protein